MILLQSTIARLLCFSSPYEMLLKFTPLVSVVEFYYGFSNVHTTALHCNSTLVYIER